MRGRLVIFLFCLLLPAVLQSKEGWTVRGVVTDAETGEQLIGAVVGLEHLWSVTDAEGKFEIPGIQEGKYNLKVSLLGYADYELQIEVKRNISTFNVRMKQNSLALKEVVVTSSKPKDGTGTSHTIGRDALNHLQITNITDMAALLPGGKTVNPDLTQSSEFTIRGAGSTSGGAAFSTAVEVDGVRLGNNASFSDPAGVDVRSVSVDNIESVEVISGVPSAEYGDLGSGIVKIHSKHGRSPWNINFSVNPRTYQGSVSKGFGVGDGSLNVSAEWARATKKIVSPYESYTRRGLSLIYSNTFAKVLRFEVGLTGNLGGMNTKDDPDAFTGAYKDGRDNVLRANTALTWLLNRNWITSLKFDASVNYNDNLQHEHTYETAASALPAVHRESEGYSDATLLPVGVYYPDKYVDSRELDLASSLKYTWNKRFSGHKSALKAGIQWKANGNAGQGEYYGDPALSPNGYRPRPYSSYPYMHNLSVYAEEDYTFPFGLQLTAGLRMESVFVKGSAFNGKTSLSPRFNAKWNVSKKFCVRAGWGIAEKLPSFNILFPVPEYRDIRVSSTSYRYYTVPYSIVYSPSFRLQRSENAELALEGKVWEIDFSLVGFRNVTRYPYKFENGYFPVSVDRDGTTDYTFVANKVQSNGSPVHRYGLELTMDFPQIKAIRTSFRLDATYTHSATEDRSLYYYYNDGWSHTQGGNRSYQYVGIYANGGNSTLTVCGRKTDNLNANLTSITHIPEAKLVITCRIEASILSRWQNIPAGSREVLYPVAYMTTDGQVHEFTEADRTNDEFKDLVKRPNNDYTFDLDGYGAYLSANLSITKEIGKHVSLSFFANNFTNSRMPVTSLATGVSTILTPNFYYGLSCRIKL